MIKAIKQAFYFPVAWYFKFWANILLKSWKPIVVVITGSSGKTTLLHLIESQIGSKAKYSHYANSAFGIPFNILGLKRKKLTLDEWFFLFLLAPSQAFRPNPKEKLYIVEADCDRPGEGKFLANLLKPEITLWINSGTTHALNFDHLVKNGKFANVEEAIAHEFGYFLEHTKKFAIVNGDNQLIQKEMKRTNAKIEQIRDRSLKKYEITNNSTKFVIEDKTYSINFITPKDVFYSIKMAEILTNKLNLPFDKTFRTLNLPAGRNSILNGIKNTTIIDSTYNATPDGVKTILEMFEKYPSRNKWLVLGDMTELGAGEKEEHEKLAIIINSMNLSKIILIGPRVSKYTSPKLERKENSFLKPKEGLDYILKNIKGEEVILFKGARFLEGIIEQLLQNKEDVDKLVRREKNWQKWRKAWGL
jgi:UDP-N-acetylmuramoyl-tripeptide--D-alanyl-D-alanine ligase